MSWVPLDRDFWVSGSPFYFSVMVSMYCKCSPFYFILRQDVSTLVSGSLGFDGIEMLVGVYVSISICYGFKVVGVGDLARFYGCGLLMHLIGKST